MKILQCFSSEAKLSLGMTLSLAGTKLSLEIVCVGGGQASEAAAGHRPNNLVSHVDNL